jgi:hypothetical protein
MHVCLYSVHRFSALADRQKERGSTETEIETEICFFDTEA